MHRYLPPPGIGFPVELDQTGAGDVQCADGERTIVAKHPQGTVEVQPGRGNFQPGGKIGTADPGVAAETVIRAQIQPPPAQYRFDFAECREQIDDVGNISGTVDVDFGVIEFSVDSAGTDGTDGVEPELHSRRDIADTAAQGGFNTAVMGSYP